MERLEPRMVLTGDDLYEPNDTQVEVNARTVGAENSPNFGLIESTRVVSNLALLDEADWYRIVLDDVGTSHDWVRIDFQHANGDLRLDLFEPNATSPLRSSNQSWTSKNFEQVSLATFGAGVYYVRVTGISGDTNPAYSLTIDPPGNTADDDFEGNDSTTLVDTRPVGGVNSPNFGLIETTQTWGGLRLEDHVDWYRIVLDDVGTSHDWVRIDFQHGDGDLRLDLFEPNANFPLRSSNQSWTSSHFEQLSLATFGAGVYYVRVSGVNGDANPAYSLTIDPPGNTADDAFEGNDSTTLVDTRPVGGVNSPNFGLIETTQTWGGLRLEDHVDWYRIVLDDVGTSHDWVRIDFQHEDGDLRLDLFEPNATFPLRSSNQSWTSKNSEQVSLATFGAGVYYVRVTGVNGDANPAYSLTIDPPGNTADDDFEGNDSTTLVDTRPVGGVNSPNFGLIDTTQTWGGLRLEDHVDWYRIVLDDVGTSHDWVRIDFQHGDGDLRLDLFEPNATFPLRSSNQSWTSSHFEQLSLATFGAGVYYVRVSGVNGDANPAYSLTIDPPGNTADDAFEGNDSTTLVDTRPVGGVNSPNFGLIETTQTWGGLRLEDHVDWYRIVLDDVGTSRDWVRIDFQHADGDLRLDLFEPNATFPVRSSNQSWTSSHFEQLSLATFEAGVYYVRVSGVNGDANPSYSLTIDPPGNDIDDGFDSNDTIREVAQRTPVVRILQISESCKGIIG